MKRRFLTALIALLILLSGCAPHVPSPTSTPEPEPDYPSSPAVRQTAQPVLWQNDGRFTLRCRESDTLNPYSCATETNRLLSSLLYEPLIGLSPEFQPESALCAAWITEDGGRSFDLTLREGAVFSDGSEVRGWDVIYSINRAREDSSFYAARLRAVSDVSLSSDGVRITLSSPRPDYPALLDIPVVKEGTAYREVPVGSGPYLYTEEGGERALVGNPYYPGVESLPYPRIDLADFAADSLVAVRHLLRERPEDAGRLIDALKADFRGYEDLRDYLRACPKYGNNIPEVDEETAEMALKISQMVRSRKNYLGNPFRPDWSSPSTHLLYGYWVAATPDGRSARDMLNYGVDPLYGTSDSGLGFRVLSMMHLPYQEMNGGMACHFGIDPKFFTGSTFEEKGLQFRSRVMKPLFFNPQMKDRPPFYLYVNVTTADTLRKVLAEPKKYAPNGVYIMRIHGTFVNFLDLSPAIQKDIITRLDPLSTAC